MEYVAKDAAVLAAMDYDGQGDAQAASQDIAGRISSIPAADVTEVRHAHWVDWEGNRVPLDDTGYPITGVFSPGCRCSDCGDPLTASDEYEVRGRFCPNCGAKMDGGGEQ